MKQIDAHIRSITDQLTCTLVHGKENMYDLATAINNCHALLESDAGHGEVWIRTQSFLAKRSEERFMAMMRWMGQTIWHVMVESDVMGDGKLLRAILSLDKTKDELVDLYLGCLCDLPALRHHKAAKIILSTNFKDERSVSIRLAKHQRLRDAAFNAAAFTPGLNHILLLELTHQYIVKTSSRPHMNLQQGYELDQKVFEASRLSATDSYDHSAAEATMTQFLASAVNCEDWALSVIPLPLLGYKAIFKLLSSDNGIIFVKYHTGLDSALTGCFKAQAEEDSVKLLEKVFAAADMYIALASLVALTECGLPTGTRLLKRALQTSESIHTLLQCETILERAPGELRQKFAVMIHEAAKEAYWDYSVHVTDERRLEYASIILGTQAVLEATNAGKPAEVQAPPETESDQQVPATSIEAQLAKDTKASIGYNDGKIEIVLPSGSRLVVDVAGESFSFDNHQLAATA